MGSTTELRQPLRRLIGSMVVEIDQDGLTIRGFNQRKRHRVTWQQIAALDHAGEQQTITGQEDEAAGRLQLDRLKAQPAAKPTRRRKG